MIKLSNQTKLKIIRLKGDGMSYSNIVQVLAVEDHVYISRRGIIKFYKKFQRTGLLYHPPTSHQSKLSHKHITFIDEAISANPELTSPEIAQLLQECTGLRISCTTVRRIRKKLGWTLKKTRYCQLIRFVHLFL